MEGKGFEGRQLPSFYEMSIYLETAFVSDSCLVGDPLHRMITSDEMRLVYLGWGYLIFYYDTHKKNKHLFGYMMAFHLKIEGIEAFRIN